MLLGTYGLQIAGVGDADGLFVEAPADWPRLDIVRRIGPGTVERSKVGEDEAGVALLGDGEVRIEREPLRATFTTPAVLSDQALIHPYLAPVASVAAHWLGRDSFHAGAYVVDGGVWGLLGDRESGKSSTLAWLAQQGHGVFCDDALIVDRDQAYAGPRSVDLRAAPAAALGVGETLGVVGARERWRVRLGDVPGALPLRGWVFLEWGEDVELIRLPSSQAIKRLFGHRSVRLPPKDPTWILDLLSLPTWVLRRPQDWDYVDDAGKRLLEVVD